MLAHDCFYNCLLWSCLWNMSETITCEGNWPFVTKIKHRTSSQVHLLQSRISTECCCCCFLLVNRELSWKIVVEFLKEASMFITKGLEEEETKLITWSSKSIKILISLRGENDSLFSKGKVRKRVTWKRISDQSSTTFSVKGTGE